MRAIVVIFCLITNVGIGQIYPHWFIYDNVMSVSVSDGIKTHTIEISDKIDRIYVVIGCSSASVYACKNFVVIKDYPDWPIVNGMRLDGERFNKTFPKRLNEIKETYRLYNKCDSLIKVITRQVVKLNQTAIEEASKW